MNRASALVVENRRLTQGIHSLWLRESRLARLSAPGQFLHIRVGKVLRRPISVCDVRGQRLRVVFRVVGQGTELLSRCRPGESLDILGPLGRKAPMPKGKRVLVCGGGVGAAPLLFLTRRLNRRNEVRVFLGARRRDELILVKEFRSLGVELVLATDDGSAGWHGPVTEPLVRAVGENGRAVVMACGPKSMLARLVLVLGPVPVWGFVEERMGCGTGICYCCALPRKDGGYVRLCKEGPVVLLNQVRL